MLVDTHLNDSEQSTLLLLPFADALFDHLSLLVCQVRVVALSVTDPPTFIRCHESIMHSYQQLPQGGMEQLVRQILPAEMCRRELKQRIYCQALATTSSDLILWLTHVST
jgi:hypothetical protein